MILRGKALQSIRCAALLGLGVQPPTIFRASDDAAAPVVQSLDAAPGTVQAGGKVTIAARVTDARSGVASVAACYERPNGLSPFEDGVDCVGLRRVARDARDGTWRGQGKINPAEPNGTWDASTLFATDAAGNRVELRHPSPPTPDGAFTVEGTSWHRSVIGGARWGIRASSAPAVLA